MRFKKKMYLKKEKELHYMVWSVKRLTGYVFKKWFCNDKLMQILIGRVGLKRRILLCEKEEKHEFGK